ncbi:MAG: hypothetical protein JST66_02755 [Bacteroidetes bacterium]|nr:hypothetical protein [Bacteroidota bacterium]
MFTTIRRHPRIVRILASLFLITFLGDVVFPTAAWALTSGPAQPEFSSFEPVVTTNMVNDFTGDFTYNLPVLQIPGPNGGGYALSLSYQSGTSAEEEASWVGYGWTLNPGAIARQMRGIPDDWNGKDDERILQHNKTIPSRTVSLSGTLSEPEAFSTDIPVSGSATLRYNNYKGFGYSAGAGAILAGGLVNLGFNVTDGEGSFSLQVNPAALLNAPKEKAKKKEKELQDKYVNDVFTDEISFKGASNNYKKAKQKEKNARSMRPDLKAIGNAYGMSAITAQTFPLSAARYTGRSFTLGLGFIPTPSPFEVGMSGNVSGQYNVQTNQETTSLPSFGYLYSANASSEDAQMDYHTENLTTYNKRDKFLSVPFADADIFAASGEGISGSMRLYPRSVQHFRPSRTISPTDLFKIGGELSGGLNWGGGIDLNYGHQELRVEGWQHTAASTMDDEPFFFRMANDPGGFVSYGSDEEENAHVTTGGYGNNILTGGMNAGKRSGRSSYIGYNTFNEMASTQGGVAYRRYEKADVGVPPDEANPDHLGELSVLNGQGQRYTYGLPVYARGDKNLNFTPRGDISLATSPHVYGADVDPTAGAQLIGTENQGGYATTYLLTSITDADYVDRNHNGPDEADLGGWTKFIYERKHGGEGTWYQWRSPYCGFIHEPGQLSECNDDMLSFSSGEKEVYYLARIETRSHVAVFHLDEEGRKDGRGASTVDAGVQVADGDMGEPVYALDKIELYTREQYANMGANRPIKTVHFRYSYAAWPNAPNAKNDAGKLTLTHVWSEYNGVVNAKIAPYTFNYSYPAAAYQAPYDSPSIASPYATADQDPAYGDNTSDAWGCYRADGDQRVAHQRPWVDQTQDPGSPSWDPAAWQLKQIILPSGGEIHIQYEPDDYLYVQNERAHALCKLDGELTASGTGNLFDVDMLEMLPAGLGVGEQAEAFDRIMQLVQQLYVDGNKKMYFRFLYRLAGNGSFDEDIDLSRNDQEFIDGYVKVLGATRTDNVLHLELGNTGHSLPRQVCQSLVRSEKNGKDLTDPCTSIDPTQGSDPGEIIGDFMGFLNNVLNVTDPACAIIDPGHSYFRLPVPFSKVGGGLRVKRLLMYDPASATASDPKLYGSEYIYRIKDEYGQVVSSGVATNEPGLIGEENILIRPLDRFNQGWLDRVIAGRDRKQSEGPLCQGMYPSPSVGYRQVLTRSIHADQYTSPVFTVKQFHTALDHPVGWERADLSDGEAGADMTSIDEQHLEVNLFGGLFNRLIHKAWLSQGFVLKLNSMHGALKSETTYSGSTDPFIGTGNGTSVLQSSTENDYYEPGDMIPVQVDKEGHTCSMLPGKDVDAVIETRSVVDLLDDASVEIDATVGVVTVPVPALVPFFSAMPSLTLSNNEVHTHVTSKVVSYPNFLKRTRIRQDGIYHISENIAFDRYTGEPIRVRTSDGFLRGLDELDELTTATNGIYTKWSLPASYVYPDMGQAAKGERKRILCTGPQAQVSGQVIADGADRKIRIKPRPGGSICDALDAMCLGDLFELSDNTTPTPGRTLYHLTEIMPPALDGSGSPYLDLRIQKASYSGSVAGGTTLSGIFIVRSGCENKLAERAGEYTAYGSGATVVTQHAQWAARLAFVQQLIDGYTSNLPTVELHTDGLPLLPPANVLTFYLHKDNGEVYFLTAREGSELCNPDGGRKQLPVLMDGDLMGSNTPFDLGSDGLIYYRPVGMECRPIRLTCPQFAYEIHSTSAVDKVVQCSATTFDDDWAYSNAIYDPTNSYTALTPYESGRKGQWRAGSAHAYRKEVASGDKNFNTGWYTMVPFIHGSEPDNAANWVPTSVVQAYSPDGTALEERSALDGTAGTYVSSCTKFGYDRSLPYLTARNAERANVLYESFERTYVSGARYEDGTLTAQFPTRVSGVAHSGSNSVSTASPAGILFAGNVTQRTMPASAGTSIKAWFRAKKSAAFVEPTGLSVGISSGPIPMTRVARSGEWVLYEATIPPQITATYPIEINCTNASTTTWMDDLRIQPADAQMTAYVYDPMTFRLLTSFDDQHFGLYYQYNAEGKLTRKQIETERGLKTVQETQYNTPLQARP